MEWKVNFYQKQNGSIPVKDFLLSLNPKLRAKAFWEIELLKTHGMTLKEPYVKTIKGDKYRGLMELRIKFGSDASRVFYFTYNNNTFILLHGFIKKSNKTPIHELERAMKYKKDFEKRCR